MEHSYFVNIENKDLALKLTGLGLWKLLIHNVVHFNKESSCKLFLLELLKYQ